AWQLNCHCAIKRMRVLSSRMFCARYQPGVGLSGLASQAPRVKEGKVMVYNNLCFSKWPLVITALFVLSVPFALASSTPLVSGSYEVLNASNVGSASQIQVRIHLVNHGSSDLSIQRMTLRDFSHADKGGTTACAVSLRAHAAVETTQQFAIRRSDYQMWKKGYRPRLILHIAGPGSAKGEAVVRLDRISGRTSGEEAK